MAALLPRVTRLAAAPAFLRQQQLLLLLLLLAAPARAQADGPQTYFLQNMSSVDDMARCLDGSPYVFYVAPGDSNVMIWLEGGFVSRFAASAARLRAALAPRAQSTRELTDPRRAAPRRRAAQWLVLLRH